MIEDNETPTKEEFEKFFEGICNSIIEGGELFNLRMYVTALINEESLGVYKQKYYLEKLISLTQEQIVLSQNTDTPPDAEFSNAIKFGKLNFLLDFLKQKEQLKETEHKNFSTSISNQINKLKWNCSPSILGYLITELATKGFIEYPLHNGEINPTGLAKICFDIFEIVATKESLIKEFNSNKNTLSETKRMKFTIPKLSDLK